MQIRGFEALGYLGLGVSAILLSSEGEIASLITICRLPYFPMFKRHFVPCHRLFIANGNYHRDEVH